MSSTWPLLFAGGFGLGLLLGEAKSWVIEWFGGWLSLHLILKARQLRKEHRALRQYRRVLNSQGGKLPADLVVTPYAKANGEHGAEYNEQSIHAGDSVSGHITYH